MITDLILKNHECHENNHLQFTPGLNIFIGATDAGKSSAFRAIYWLINNRPLGDSMFPLFWEGITEIEGRFVNPTGTIVRIKDKKDWNHYIINDQDPINAGSGAPPESVRKLINMDDINFQTQIDRAFLMFETPGERGRILNKIAGLDDIDRTIDNAKRDEQKLKRNLETEQALLISLQEQKVVYKNLEEQEEQLLICEQLEKEITQTLDKINTLSKVIQELSSLDGEIEEAERLLPAETLIYTSISLCTQQEASGNRIRRVRAILTNLAKVDSAIEGMEEYTDIEIRFTEIKQLLSNISLSEQKVKKLQNTLRQISIIEVSTKKLETETELLEKQLPKKCLTCGKLL